MEVPQTSPNSSAIRIRDILPLIEEKAPRSAAESWDNVGLLLGSSSWETTGAIVSTDLSLEAIELAQKNGYHLILTHHPCIFPKREGWSSLIDEGPEALKTLAMTAIQNKIAVIAAHTNFDRCAMEVSSKISEGLGAKPLGRVIDCAQESLEKLVVFVPADHIDSVQSAIFSSGGGQIGNYDQCRFSLEGEGSFRGREGADPFIGKVGQFETAREVRLETILPRSIRNRVIRAMKEAHPYEEVAYDLYSVLQKPSGLGMVSGLGYGFWGEFSSAIPFSGLASRVKTCFEVKDFWLTEGEKRDIQRIAFTPGKGASFMRSVIGLGCDVFITGEVGYHSALEGRRAGVSVIELGHRQSEKFFIDVMCEWMHEFGLQTKPHFPMLQAMR